jgi:CTP:molybdopterin cytidylyltransferase MocA
MTDARPHVVILAAGSGKRFLGSGGVGYKQLTPYEGEPVIARLVRQVEETGLFSGTTVVLGEDRECGAAIREALDGRQVAYAVNRDARRDNNLLSFRAGTHGVDSACLIIEADCVVARDDLVGMVGALEPDEIRWSEIGDVSGFDYGGLIETDPGGERAISIAVLSREEFSAFKSAGRKGVKMFGLSAFGAKALALYRDRITGLADPYNKYFHYIAIQDPRPFRLSTYRVTADSFSFNTVTELR